MRTALLLLLALQVGCSSDTTGPEIPPVPDSGGDSATTTDGGGSDGGGKLAFGTPCTDNAQCESNVCFKGGSRTFCSFRCTQATVATDCPKPPTDGTCNNQGYCKAPE
jgi:hypothetical protein